MSKTSGQVVIVGAGHAGGSAAALLRQYGWQGPIILIGAEQEVPYQRPPLSKAWLKGEQQLADLLLRPAAFYPGSLIDLRLGCEVTAIDRAGGCVVLSDGERVGYDHLILATGCHARALPVTGHRLGGVAALRTLADADRLRPLLHTGARVAIIGAGYIGLEVAASARSNGAKVVVIEREARVLPRVASAPLSDFFQRRHVSAGVRIITNATVEAFEGDGDRVAGVRLSDGEVIDCDAVLVGIGAAPNQALAQAAGLACDNGIHVDLAARTADPAIHAIGDCTQRPVPLYQRTCRLESVPNALEQAKQAAADLCGRAPPAPEVPWFWSDQYEVRLQIAGLPFDVVAAVVRGDPASGVFAAFHLAEDGTVQAVEAVNAPAEFMAGRMMIARRKRVVASRLADVSCSIRELAG
ncbi:MAG TPA: FAD-dependent oxidoreductase [Acetobacteraceae bacterium]|jgi:3-phenylpropionate/trans-cinnamate dioxygenase ferredoxin reductase subunit|nr:FAD-dependent oxidoreductase [Acetobacteraceae bacterium]